MVTVRKGSKGSDVIELQKLLGISVDGVFGPATEKAVIEFQQKNGLVADGIVGEKTWAKLYGEIAMVKAYIYTHITRSPNRPVKYIAVHYTAGGSSRKGTAQNTRNVFLNRKASADFVVDDAEIVQINPDLKNCYCWSVGDAKNTTSGGGQLYGVATNRNTISIEICSNLKKGWSPSYPNHEGWYYTDEALANAKRLIEYLMRRFNVPKSNVVRHYDISGKLCPGVIGWNNADVYTNEGKSAGKKNNSIKWTEFWNKLGK